MCDLRPPGYQPSLSELAEAKSYGLSLVEYIHDRDGDMAAAILARADLWLLSRFLGEVLETLIDEWSQANGWEDGQMLAKMRERML